MSVPVVYVMQNQFWYWMCVGHNYLVFRQSHLHAWFFLQLEEILSKALVKEVVLTSSRYWCADRRWCSVGNVSRWHICSSDCSLQRISSAVRRILKASLLVFCRRLIQLDYECHWSHETMPRRKFVSWYELGWLMKNIDFLLRLFLWRCGFLRFEDR